MARSSRSAAAITSSSRTEPPGWAMAVAPERAASSTPSGKGKNASDPSAAPFAFAPALSAAIRTESTRLVWPMPMPTVTSRRASTMALDFTCFTTLQANDSASSSSAVGARFVTTFQPRGSASARSRVCKRSPPGARRAAGVGVLHDHRGGEALAPLGLLLDGLQRRGAIEDVVVGELLALDLARRRQRRLPGLRHRRVERGALVRVLAVAQRLQP